MADYFMPAPNQGALSRLMTRISTGKRPRPSFPRAVQIQTTSRCNAKCLFCGYNETRDLPQGDMDDDLFTKIADECGRHFVGRVSPYLMNEPLVDKKLPQRIAYLNKVRKPGTKTKINTNGALLTEDVSEALIDAKLRHLWISVQGIRAETYKQSMGLDLAKTLANIDTFLDIRARKKAALPKLTITMLHTALTDAEMDEAHAYWAERDVRFKVHHMDNRAGKDLSGLAVRKPKLRRNCSLFLKQAYILYNGDMVICCHDWRRTIVLGNVGESSIKEIWNSSHFKDLIHEYQAGDYSNLALCRTCTTS
ncbi:MAG: radical SAM protein [Desulfovibrio sp.]|nr:MAG: radical SAM protein [Desulfovibrio sp.]